MMDRISAGEVLKENLQAENLIHHSLAVEAVMRKLAERLEQDADRWALAGLLHDIDYEQTDQTPERHGMVGADYLVNRDVDEEICHAIQSHNEMTGVPRESLMDKALYCADPVTGLITSAALVKPDKSLASVELKSLKKKFKDKAFARGANREQMRECDQIGLTLDEFLQLSIEAMQGIHEELGL